MVRVLFVCLGNICRSPMAEAVFAEKVRSAGLEDRIEADSAGTGHWHLGEPPHRGTRDVLRRQRIQYEGRARLLSESDLDRFDYIVAMDSHNLRDIVALAQPRLDFRNPDAKQAPRRARIRTLMSYAPELGHEEVPDPYYSGRFDDVFRLVDAATDRLLEDIRAELEP